MGTFYPSFFPQGIASGENFCNREKEREQLNVNIKTARPTLLMSPRRYGKTSLVLHVLSSQKYPYAHMDLFAELNEIDIQNAVLTGIGNIISEFETKTQQALKSTADFFAEFNVNFKYVGTRLQVEFSKTRKAPAKAILEALKKLDAFLKKKNTKAILFFDEFQKISQIAESMAIEATIRQVAQESKHICFIFSGSNRNLLSNLFDDQKKPLYKLCDRMNLERISEADYIPFIVKKFYVNSKKSISKEVAQMILELTERHPYYVNVLCYKLLLSNLNLLSADDVEKMWHHYAMGEKSNVINEIDLLSTNQSKMLISLAKYGDKWSLTEKEFLLVTKFSVSSAIQAVKALMKRDYVEETKKGNYIIIDPLIKYIFHEAV